MFIYIYVEVILIFRIRQSAGVNRAEPIYTGAVVNCCLKPGVTIKSTTLMNVPTANDIVDWVIAMVTLLHTPISSLGPIIIVSRGLIESPLENETRKAVEPRLTPGAYAK
jgi:hypothetical protein